MTTNSSDSYKTNSQASKSGPTQDKSLTQGVKAGGCAAKLSSFELKQILAGLPKSSDPNLLSGIENFEDAAVYKLTDNMAVVETVDFFPPMVDDPYLFGQIAANNALSDIYAMGGKPLLALAILSFPTCDQPLSVAKEILRGGADMVARSGAIMAGGHSIQSTEITYGLCVTGLVEPSDVLTNSGAKSGDRIILTKPIGTGVSLLALKAELISEESRARLFSALTTSNSIALQAVRGGAQSDNQAININACTDVTGFGLIGHLQEMAKASKLGLRIHVNKVPFLPQCLELAAQGLVPAGAYANRKSFEQNVSYIKDLPLELSDLLYDPQTAGGLLLAVAEGQQDELLTLLSQAGVEAAEIGNFEEGIPGHIDLFYK
jgi:selenide,water dikinase